MKNKLIIFGCIVVFVAMLFGSCRYNTDIANPQQFVKIYMPQAVDNPVEYHFIMSDTDQVIIYGGNYGGTGYPSSDIPVEFIADTSLTNSYNQQKGTHYVSMPAGSFSLEQTKAIIPKGKVSTKPLELRIKTLGALEPSVSYLLPLKIKTSKTDSTVSKELGITYFVIEAKYDLIHILMPQADKIPNIYSFNMADSAQTIFYNAAYDGADPAADIDITFKADTTLTDSFNIRQGTSYPSMPAGSYELVDSNTHIEKGKTQSAPLALKIKTKGLLKPFKEYLLPVRIEKASGDLPVSQKVVIDEKKAVSYFLIQATRNGVELTIVSYGKGSGYNDMEALANSIKIYHPDLLVVREMDLNTNRSGPTDQPKKLAELLDMPYYAFANALNYNGGEYGSAVFSKYPIVADETKTYMLSSTKSEKGPLAIIKVMVNDSLPLYFAGVHLNANGTIRNTMQVPELLNYTKAYDGPFILAGNFNANPSDMSNTYGQMATQFTFPCHDCPPNYPASNPKTHSDYIMYKPDEDFLTLDYSVGQSAVGKHLPVILKVKWYPE